jgi:hypothetical protein
MIDLLLVRRQRAPGGASRRERCDGGPAVALRGRVEEGSGIGHAGQVHAGEGHHPKDRPPGKSLPRVASLLNVSSDAACKWNIRAAAGDPASKPERKRTFRRSITASSRAWVRGFWHRTCQQNEGPSNGSGSNVRRGSGRGARSLLQRLVSPPPACGDKDKHPLHGVQHPSAAPSPLSDPQTPCEGCDSGDGDRKANGKRTLPLHEAHQHDSSGRLRSVQAAACRLGTVTSIL